MLRRRAETHGSNVVYRFLGSGEDETARLSFNDLDRRARAIAVALRQQCVTGDRALLVHPPGLEFLPAFFGCLYAGVVAVPVYPPRSDEPPARLASIAADAGARIVLTTPSLLDGAAYLRAGAMPGVEMRVLTTDNVDIALADDWLPPSLRSDTLAFLQYTSGSTGQPKGVMLTHGNLLANQEMIRRAHGLEEDGVIGGWLPLYHDMGLIGMGLQAVFAGASCVLMSPARFLQKPLSWLRLLSRYRVTTTGAPDFAYDLCVRRTTAEERSTLDLSALRTAFNGAEPIRSATMERFTAAFADCGLRRDLFLPCYGLAEASLLVTGRKYRGRVVVTARFDPLRLAKGRAIASRADRASTLTSSGWVAEGLTLRIVDPVTRRVRHDGLVGEIWVRGPSIGTGYWNRPELTAATFDATIAGPSRERYLRTGDLGFLRRGELFVTGRLKDLIIVRGRNFHPQDIEATARAADPALRPHGSAAFGVDENGAEEIVVVQEIERAALRRLEVDVVIGAIRQAVVRDHGVAPAAIVLVKPATLPKTTSGKIRRSTCREQFLQGTLAAVGEWRATDDTGAATEPVASGVTAERSPRDVNAAALQAWLIERVAAALRISPESIDPRAPLQTLGLDSMATVTLAGELEAYLGCSVAPTIVFDFPTIELLARNLVMGSVAARNEIPQPSRSSAERTREERAIAVVGLGCRFPGGAINPAAFWAMLCAGTDAVGEIPRDRWDVPAFFDVNPDAAGKMYVQQGAFLDTVDGFDPDFFGIAPRDAVAMDPQHRLLLEVAWEALEHAGIAPASLTGKACGVFVGLSFDDYARIAAPVGEGNRIDAYSALGSARSLAAARLSYHLGLHGPAMVVDTLCSSSLLAVHLAIQSLRAGECRVALAGGANLMLAPETMIASCKLKALARDGRCKTFDAEADGYGRGEGAGIVVLKREKDAIADGDPVLAVLQGSAVNHDGRSNGLTAPNGVAQEALLRSALADARVAPRDVSFVETHGTGTVLGDPIEVQALANVYGEGRSADVPLLLGAVKTNIGHLEAAAGIAGLLKTVLAIQHGVIPANLHFHRPNPLVPWESRPVRVVSRSTPWPARSPRIAGVSAFGLSGTNVHVVVGAAPQQSSLPSRLTSERPRHLFTLSGRNAAAAVESARDWAVRIAAEPDAELGDICFTANAGRSAFACRRALVATSRDQLATRLRALAAGDFVSAATSAPAVAFLFPGQGCHYAGMARELHDSHAGFRSTIERCADLFAELLPERLTAALFGPDPTLLDDPLYGQPAVFAVEVALGRLWLEWGVRPAGMFGHGLGEYAAACVAGVFSLEDGARLVATKVRLTHALGHSGAMISVGAAPDVIMRRLAFHPEIEIAALNGPHASTLTGPRAAIARISEDLRRSGVTVRSLASRQAFHSRALEPLLEKFRAVAAQVTFHRPTIPIVTCRDGRVAGPELTTPDYWVRQMRDPVQFARGVKTLAAELGCRAFLDVGPQPSLVSLAHGALSREDSKRRLWLPSLRASRPDWEVLLGSVGELYQRGLDIDWTGFERPYPRRRLSDWPTYPFQRRRCWVEASPSTPVENRALVTDNLPTFALRWQEVPRAVVSSGVKEWQLVCPDDQVAALLIAAFAARSEAVQRVAQEDVRNDRGTGATPRGLLVAGLAPRAVFALAKALIGPVSPPTQLWLITRLAVATGRESESLQLESAPLAGFARSFALEHPAHWGGLVDVDQIDAATAHALVDDVLARSDEGVIALRGGARLAARLQSWVKPAAAGREFQPKGTCLVTGGNGGLGSSLIQWLVAQGARHIVSVSRNAPSAETQGLFDELTKTGATVRWLRADVAAREDLSRALTEIEETMPPLTGVFHAAGVVGFDPLEKLTEAGIADVLTPKVTGARNLHELTRGRALDDFVLFSSIAAVWGSTGQTHYAAANAYLDSLAHERRAAGLPALTINWGPWDTAGLPGVGRDQLRRIGLVPFSPAAAMAMLGRLMTAGAPQVIVARVDWNLLHPVLSLRRPLPLIAEFAPSLAGAPTTSETLVRLRKSDATQRDRMLADYLQRELGRVLGRSEDEPIDPQGGFFALGMDSLMAVELRTRLESDLAITLPSTIAFDRATLSALHAELKALLFPAGDEVPAGPEPARRQSPSGEPIAIVGMACRFPGGAASPEEFWALLREGRHGIVPVPHERWDAAGYFHPDAGNTGTMYVREFGFIDGVDRFDHGFFNLHPREAASMDPQQRIVLETAWEALESAGLANARLRGSPTGVFVGVSTNDYASRLLKSGDVERIDAYFGTGNALNAIAGRLAHVFGLCGPTWITDTACSSSLVALHQACESLRAGECGQALVAGVNLMLIPEPAIVLCRARMLAPDGRCKTFAADADGYGRGEGCGVVVLKPLAAARAAGDTVLAVVTGSAINQDGASSGFTVPNGTAQQELVRRALAVAGRTADDLDYVEAHGTGTPLGDPIELNALAAVAGRTRSRPLFVGSVKTNLGHLEAAAGIAGVIKTTLALHHAAIPPHLNFTRPTPQVAWNEMPLQVPVQLTPWPVRAAAPRVAGVSAFGFTGTNAHVILESVEQPDLAEVSPRSLHVIPLSARTPEALLALRRRVLAWLTEDPELRLADVAHTFGCGRTHHEVREAFVAGSRSELRAQLLAHSGSQGARAAGNPPPVAFVCTTSDAIEAGREWQRWGLKPALVIGEGAGLIPAGVLAGIFLPEDAPQLLADPGAIAKVTLRGPRVSFGLRRGGRVADALAASREWWRSALAGEFQAGPAEPGEERELVLTRREERGRLALAAELYVAGYDLDWLEIAPRTGARHQFSAPRYAFQRSRHWIEVTRPVVPRHSSRHEAAPAGALPAGTNALLGTRIPLPGSSEVRFAAEHSARAPALLEHHRLFGRVIAPAAQHISMVIAAARAAWAVEACTISGLRFPEAVRLGDEETRAIQLVLIPEEAGAFRVRVMGAPTGSDTKWTTHAEGTVKERADAALAPVISGRLLSESELTGGEFYRMLGQVGYTLGESFRWVHSVRRNGDVAMAVLMAPSGALEPAAYDVHPGLLDSCFQLLGWCAGIREGELGHGAALYIPAAIEKVRYLRRPSKQALVAEVRVTEPDHARTHRLRGDIRLTEEDGTLVLEVSGFEARRAPRELLAAAGSPPAARYHRFTWVEVPRDATSAPIVSAVWSFLGESATARALAGRLRARGHRVDHPSVPAADASEVVLFCDDPAGLADTTVAQAVRLLTLVQTLAALERHPRLWVITRGAQALERDHGPVPIGAAAAVGLARIVALEHPELRPVLIDLDPDVPGDEAAALEEQLWAADGENQIALRGPRRLAARLAADDPAPFPGTQGVRLAAGRFGDLDTLTLRPAVRATPGTGEVEVEVRAAGLNFRDVLNALGGLEPHLVKLGVGAATQLPLGGECAGVISAVGAGVKHLRRGDAVIAAFAPGSMGSHVTADARFVLPKPRHLPWTEAATLPVAYMTAFYALRECAALRPGERVLIHSAAGGVGLAAIHVARALGAEICATASPAKWPALQRLGVRSLGISRSTVYADEFAPVDVVLNSLTGDHVPRSLELLAPGGRFVEIGKIGIWTAEQIAVKRPDVEYHVFDLVEMARNTPEVLQRLLRDLAIEWQAGRLPPLPWRTYPLTAAADAFRFMAQARHVGKLVLVRPPSLPPRPQQDGVYIITGGLGGIGFAVAGWLARAGAGTIVLVSRRPPSTEQGETMQLWRAAGTHSVWHGADLAQAGAAERLIKDVAREFGLVRGVFHAAGVLDDGLVAQQTPARLAAVYAPKAGAAWQLHEATLGQPLDYFVLFSSLAAMIGSPGQSTYAAANAALDALAVHRQRLGLPGLSINWGPWAHAGMTARLDDRQRARMAAAGLTPFSETEGLERFGELLLSAAPRVATAHLHVPSLLAAFGGRVPPLFRLPGSGAPTVDTKHGALRSELRALPADQRLDRIKRELGLRFAELLGLADGEGLPRDRSLTALGFDSLMLVELKSWLAGPLRIEIPVQEIAGFSVEELARRILDESLDQTTPPRSSAADDIERKMWDDAVLSDDIRPAGPVVRSNSRPAVLLTGATGFLGAFLLQELLVTTGSTVHCLVRAADTEEGCRRVLENLRSYGLDTGSSAGRLVIVCGDLAQPRFGLTEAAFEALARAIDVIYHNGAWLNFFYGYEALRAANVLGTREVLRLAVRGAPKPVHYVSTAGVFYSRHYRGRLLPETDPAEHCEGHPLGYSQSKWVAERLVAAAGSRGLPVTVYRAPFITGHAETGAWNTDDFISRLVRGVVALGALPEFGASMDIVPVNYVARAIARLASDPESAGRRFHLCASGEVPWSALAGWLGENGYVVRREPYAAWVARLAALRGTDHPLEPFIPLFLEKSGPDRPTVPELFLQSVHSRLDGTATAQRLAAAGIAVPKINAALWRTYLASLAAAGLLPAPTPLP